MKLKLKGVLSFIRKFALFVENLHAFYFTLHCIYFLYYFRDSATAATEMHRRSIIQKKLHHKFLPFWHKYADGVVSSMCTIALVTFDCRLVRCINIASVCPSSTPGSTCSIPPRFLWLRLWIYTRRLSRRLSRVAWTT